MSVPSDGRCLVTGASDPTSVGYACALALLRAGASHVTLMGRDRDRVSDAVAGILKREERAEGYGVDLSVKRPRGRVSGVVGDLKDPETMPGVVGDAICAMGGLDVLVVSGGNGGSEYLGLDAADPASYRTMHDVAVLSPLLLAEAAAPELAKASSPAGGAIIMVSSVATQVPWPDTAPYNCAKAAQNCLIETLAFKFRTGNVRVNGILPAAIHTGALNRMAAKKGVGVKEYAELRGSAHPMGRCGTPQDVANAVVFLASPASGFITGELLKVDGGLHLSSWFNKPKLLAEFVGGTKAT